MGLYRDNGKENGNYCLGIRFTFFGGVLIIRTVVFWGLYGGSPIWGKYHIGFTVEIFWFLDHPY